MRPIVLPSCILSAAETLFPGYFALVMATGALSIAFYLLQYPIVAYALLAVSVLAYGMLWVLLLVRLLYFPARISDDFFDHARAPGFFTLVAGTCVLGTDAAITSQSFEIATLLWVAGILLWVIVMYSFFTAVVTRANKPDLEDGINGAWLIAAVATQSVAVLGGLLAPSFPAPEIPLFFCLVMYLIGCMLYLSIITLIFYRLTFIRLTSATFTPPYWINMGAVAITTLAGATLMLHASLSPLLATMLPFLEGFTLFFWAAATWWIPLLLILMVWRHGVMRHPFRYEPQYWAMAFPLAMYTTGTFRLAQALRLDFLMIIPSGFVWLALTVWLVIFAGMARRLVTASYVAPPLSSPAPIGSRCVNEQADNRIKIGILTASDRASSGVYVDESGPAIQAALEDILVTAWVPCRRLVSDEQPEIERALVELADIEGCPLIVTTGGTGPAPRDVTPEATAAVSAMLLPGFGELMRAISLHHVPTAILSRQTAGIRGGSLIVNLPGKPAAIRECLMAVFPAIPYGIDLIGGPRLDTNASVVAAFRPGERR